MGSTTYFLFPTQCWSGPGTPLHIYRDEVATDGKKSRWGPLLQLDNSDSAKIRVFIHEDRVVFPGEAQTEMINAVKFLPDFFD